MSPRKIYDISLDIHERMAIYPGNPRVRIKRVSDATEHHTAKSLLVMGSHTGTHIDAPRHISKKARGVDQIPLHQLVGTCRVIDLSDIPFGKGIGQTHLARTRFREKIILLKTRNSKRRGRTFHNDYVYLSPEGAHYLWKRGVRTVGIDALGIQKFKTPICAAHCILLKNNIVIVEGLDLRNVPKGTYSFVCLPLKIRGADGAPARAILTSTQS